MSTKKVGITFLPSNHREVAKERYVTMMNEHYSQPQEPSYEDEYNYEQNKKRREREAFEEKFWTKWNKYHAPQPEPESKPSTFEPFIGPHNQTYVWEDEDGYTVYSSKPQMQLKIEASREAARMRKIRRAEERIMLANKCKR